MDTMMRVVSVSGLLTLRWAFPAVCTISLMSCFQTCMSLMMDELEMSHLDMGGFFAWHESFIG